MTVQVAISFGQDQKSSWRLTQAMKGNMSVRK